MDALSSLFGLSQADFEVLDWSDGDHALRWKQGAFDYYAWFPAGTKAWKLTLNWSRDKPTLQDLIRCIGIPESYSAVVRPDMGGNAFMVDLWYPRQGFLARLAETERWGTRSNLDLTTQFHGMEITRPGPIRQMAQDLFFGMSSTDIEDKFLRDLKPWPAKAEDLTVTRK